MIKLNNEIFEQKFYPDGTPLIRSISPFTHDIAWYFDSMDELFTVSCIVRHLQERGFKTTLFMPYIPNARMDRIKTHEDVFTLKYFCEAINAMHFASVAVLDPHSSVSAGLLDRVMCLEPLRLIEHARHEIFQKTGENPFFVYPDEGAMKRYQKTGQYTFCVKHRNWEDGHIQGLDMIGEIPSDYPALIIDDICSRGGTFIHTAAKLKELGVKSVFLCVTHCENTILTGDLLNGEYVDGVFTTNSIFRGDHPMISVMEAKEAF